MRKQLKRLLAFGLSLGLVTVLSVPAFAVGPRAADMDNAKDVWGGAYDNPTTNAVPNANGVVTTPAGGGSSPLCKITVTGLLPIRLYRVWVDTNGGLPNPFIALSTFMTNDDGTGQYRCADPLVGEHPRVYIVDQYANKTVLVSEEVVDD